MALPHLCRNRHPGALTSCKPSRGSVHHRALLTLAIAIPLLFACTDAPTWTKLLASKIAQQYPGYSVKTTDDGNLLVVRPGLPAVPVDAHAIGRFCQRGPKDCNYATDLMLLELQPK